VPLCLTPQPIVGVFTLKSVNVGITAFFTKALTVLVETAA